MNYVIKLSILIFISPYVFAHAGAHENQKCFITLSNITLNLSGYQFQGQYPQHVYCRVFPELGETVIKVESVDNSINDEKIILKLLKFNFKSGWLFDAKNFFLLKQTPKKGFHHGVNMIQVNIKEEGLYALDIELNSKNKIFYQRFLFLAGISVTRILMFFSTGILVLLIFFLGRKILNCSVHKNNLS